MSTEILVNYKVHYRNIEPLRTLKQFITQNIHMDYRFKISVIHSLQNICILLINYFTLTYSVCLFNEHCISQFHSKTFSVINKIKYVHLNNKLISLH